MGWWLMQRLFLHLSFFLMTPFQFGCLTIVLTALFGHQFGLGWLPTQDNFVYALLGYFAFAFAVFLASLEIVCSVNRPDRRFWHGWSNNIYCFECGQHIPDFWKRSVFGIFENVTIGAVCHRSRVGGDGPSVYPCLNVDDKQE